MTRTYATAALMLRWLHRRSLWRLPLEQRTILFDAMLDFSIAHFAVRTRKKP